MSVLTGRCACRYENDSIFDKFEISLSPNGKQFVTGSYNGNFHIYDIDGTLNTTLKAQKYQGAGGNRYGNEALDVGRKVLHTSWHPTDNTVAITCHDSVYLYSKQ